VYKFSLILNTIIHLKPIQIRYQLWYRIHRYWRNAIRFNYPLSITKEGHPLKLIPWIEKPVSFNENTFSFLNKSKTFRIKEINWDFSEYGKLWTYNLNYFGFLLQPEIDIKTGKLIITNFIQNAKQNSIGIEPYPIALRGINWIKFFSQYSILNTQYSNSLYAQYQILLNNLKYHLLGNHLLEDGFSLLFGAFYFEDQKLYKKAKEIIESELEEQILEDGGHFELSPMYHQIILDRLLDCINLFLNNHRFKGQDNLLELMKNKAMLMLAWLELMTFSNGEIPLFNDSAPGIAPTTEQLLKYAKTLNFKLSTRNSRLSTSGYRRFNGNNYECILDIGQIGPNYQPGHAHADTFNFILNVNNKPLIIDTGISTYNPGERRTKERGTTAHNTVTILDKNSSEVWSSFRVARRAKVKIIKEENKTIIAQHDGYQKLRTTHQRTWIFSENKIQISDTLTGKTTKGKAYLWLTPELKPIQKGHTIEVGMANLTFENADSIRLITTQIPIGYNHFSNSIKIEIEFNVHSKLIVTAKS